MNDEDPPPSPSGRTPAERAGATPLDPSLFRGDDLPVVRRRRGGRRSDARDSVPAGQVTSPAADTEAVGSAATTGPAGSPVDSPIGSPASDPAAQEPPVIRRRRRRRSSRRWLTAAAALAVVALLCAAAGWLTDSDVATASGPPPDLVLATPVLSARRAPELVSRPMAARQLSEAVAPVLAAAPQNTCLTVREGAEPLAAHNEAASVVPASNMKVVVGAAALALLDPHERLVTRFATDGAPTDGTTVRGNLYMIGGGDPLLTTNTYEALFTHGIPPVTDLESVADRVAATGITRVSGSVVGDGSRYDTTRVVESWPERYLTQGQVSPLSALVVNDGWTVDALATGVGGGPTADPDQHAAAVMTALLEARGVVVDGEPVAGVAPEGASNLVEAPSATITELVAEMLRFSDNTTAELLVKEIGLRTGGEGSTAAGLAAIETWLTESGFDTTGLVLADGSGLSPDGRVTCQLLSSLLVADGPQGPMATGLATPGDPGTLDDRMHPGPLEDAVRAKTGTLRAVTALSGWLHTRPSHDLAFAFVINTDDRQIVASDVALQDRLLEVLLDHPQTPPLDALSPAAPTAPS